MVWVFLLLQKAGIAMHPSDSEVHFRKPRWPVVISIIQGCFLAPDLWILLTFDKSHFAEHLPVYALSCFGVFFTLLGLPMFWLVNGAGWVLLFLGHLSFIFQGLTNILTHDQLENYNALETALGLFLHLAFIRTLLLSPVYELYASPQLRLWLRAHRHKTNIQGAFSFANRRVRGAILDVSETGCLLQSEAEIPLGEILYFRPEIDDDFSLEMQLLRKVTKIADISAAPNNILYGARFKQKLSDRGFLRLRRAETPSELQALPVSE